MFIFLHIPRTGGGTFSEIIRRTYRAGAVAFLRKDSDMSRVKVLYGGHLWYGVHKKLSGKCRYITFLRDPVERVVSWYYWLKGVKQYQRYVGGESLASWIRSDRLIAMGNLQTRMLCADLCLWSGYRIHWGSCDGVVVRELTEEHFREAQRVLCKDFAWVGVTERMDDSLGAIGRVLGVRLKRGVPRQRVCANRPRVRDLSEELVGEIEERNKYDRRLYEQWRK